MPKPEIKNHVVGSDPVPATATTVIIRNVGGITLHRAIVRVGRSKPTSSKTSTASTGLRAAELLAE